jgi:hypothetical protein
MTNPCEFRDPGVPRMSESSKASWRTQRLVCRAVLVYAMGGYREREQEACFHASRFLRPRLV